MTKSPYRIFDSEELAVPIGTQAFVGNMPKEYEIVHNSQDVQYILDSIGITEHYGFLVILIADSEYNQVWAGKGIIPYNNSLITRIK